MNTLYVFALIVLSGCCQYVPVGVPTIANLNETSCFELPGVDTRFVYYKASGSSQVSAAKARQQAYENLNRQLARSVYQALRYDGWEIEENQIDVSCVMAVCGPTVIGDCERRVVQSYALPCKKNRTAQVLRYEVTLIAHYSRADLLRLLRECFGGK